MKQPYFILSLLCLFFTSCASNPQLQAAYDLIGRVTPGYENQFQLELLPTDGNQDVFEISAGSNKVILRGTNTIALATAYNQYLKYTCNAHVSWLGNQLNLPEQLPMPAKDVRDTINGKYRVYMNYCTVSYSAAWWDWERWQKEIDFMAMNSINMPLSVIGLDAVWYNTLLKHGFTDEEARSFLVGPTHQAWQWMQNIQSYGGPLPKSWIDKHITLGKQIMARQLELGMQPIQQGFSGYVPRELKNKYPSAQIRLQRKWCGFEGAAQLDPTDSLFQVIGHDFLVEQKKLFGAHGVYAADPFHESKPPVNTPEYLHQVGEAIHKLFKDFDEHAVWAMQAWSLREPILKAVPKTDIIVLDLNGARSQKKDAFWGYNTVAGNLHNFGGRINLHGDLKLLASNQYMNALQKSPNICGSGMFMEGIEQNPVYYDLAFEMPLHQSKVDLSKWLFNYAIRRYGAASENATQAWNILLDGPYKEGTNGTERSSIIAARPALEVKKSGPNAGFGNPYLNAVLFKAQGLLLVDVDKLGASEGYRFDLVDIQRQLMSNLGQEIHRQAAQAFAMKDKKAFELHSQRFLTLLKDVDEVLRTRSELNMYRWVNDARSWGDTQAEKDLYEKDATALVTIWGPDEAPLIYDYSWREWAGLIEHFYLPRWTKFYQMLSDCLQQNKKYSEKGLHLTHGRESFRANDFYNELANWELNFVNTPGKLQGPITQGDELEVVKRMYAKYLAMAAEYYTDDARVILPKAGEKTYENLGED